uniref:Rho-GAP domain-containing protein n=1 Tax=Salvator merianae TaxID=96440 RepID=A0A8D0E262_SALMN
PICCDSSHGNICTQQSLHPEGGASAVDWEQYSCRQSKFTKTTKNFRTHKTAFRHHFPQRRTMLSTFLTAKRQVVVKEPDEGELEEEWLKEAGLSILFGEASGDCQESIVVLATLTRTQAAAVQKRVETVTQTMRKKNKQYQVPDVRDIFKQQNELEEKEMGVRTNQIKDETLEKANEAHCQHIGDFSPSEDMPVIETDINLEISFSEQAASLKDVDKVSKGKDDDTLLPNFRLPKDKTGTTKIGDLAPQDMKKVHALALIELTALFDVLGTELKPQKAIKIKTKDCGLFGLPLSVLLEQDQKRMPGLRIPLIFQKLISHIEEGKLDTEGILRIPGVAARVKNLSWLCPFLFWQPINDKVEHLLYWQRAIG